MVRPSSNRSRTAHEPRQCATRCRRSSTDPVEDAVRLARVARLHAVAGDELAGGVRLVHREQLGRLRAVDPHVRLLAQEQGQASHVVAVRVRQDHRVDAGQHGRGTLSAEGRDPAVEQEALAPERCSIRYALAPIRAAAEHRDARGPVVPPGGPAVGVRGLRVGLTANACVVATAGALRGSATGTAPAAAAQRAIAPSASSSSGSPASGAETRAAASAPSARATATSRAGVGSGGACARGGLDRRGVDGLRVRRGEFGAQGEQRRAPRRRRGAPPWSSAARSRAESSAAATARSSASATSACWAAIAVPSGSASRRATSAATSWRARSRSLVRPLRVSACAARSWRLRSSRPPSPRRGRARPGGARARGAAARRSRRCDRPRQRGTAAAAPGRRRGGAAARAARDSDGGAASRSEVVARATPRRASSSSSPSCSSPAGTTPPWCSAISRSASCQAEPLVRALGHEPGVADDAADARDEFVRHPALGRAPSHGDAGGGRAGPWTNGRGRSPAARPPERVEFREAFATGRSGTVRVERRRWADTEAGGR